MIRAFRTRFHLGVIALTIIVFALALALHDVAVTQAYPHDPTQACFVADFNNDGKIDIVDMQTIASHYGFSLGSSFYNVRYDFEPYFPAPDGDIDIKEVQLVFGRFGGRCAIAKTGYSLLGHDLPVAGTFFAYVTVEGYTASTIPFGLRVLDVNAARSRGYELCNSIDDVLPNIINKWNSSNLLEPDRISPYTLFASGYYNLNAFACWGGHVLFTEAWAYWQNALLPQIAFEQRPNTTTGSVHCYALWPVEGTQTPNCYDQPSRNF